MSFKNHNNNDRQPTNTTYSPVSFSNPEALDGSRLNISYFNKLLQVSIQKRNGTKNDYATYDTENSSDIYLSINKAKILYDLIQMMKKDDTIHNVCVETNKGLLMVSDGSDYGVTVPCISISTSGESGVETAVYVTKDHYHKGAFNFNMDNNEYTDQYFDKLEIDIFENVLLQYYNAATYAIAATVMEASMYKHNAIRNTINAIAEKVGVEFNSNSNGGGYNSKSQFLNGNGNQSSSSGNDGMSGGVPKEYEAATFDDIAHGMGA